MFNGTYKTKRLCQRQTSNATDSYSKGFFYPTIIDNIAAFLVERLAKYLA